MEDYPVTAEKLKNFYYKNIFGERDFTRLKIGVRENLQPFQNLLENLLKNNDRIMRVSANVKPVDDVVSLEPEFSIIKIKGESKAVYGLPDSNYFILEWPHDKADIDELIEITDRKRWFVLTLKDKVDYYQGFVIFKSEKNFQGALNLWYGKDEENAQSVTCDLRMLNYAGDFGKYRIKAKSSVESVEIKDGKLFLNGVADEFVTLFNCEEIKRVIKDANSVDEVLCAENLPVKKIKDGYYLVNSTMFKKLTRNGEEISFERVAKKDYPKLLNDEALVFKGNKFYLENGQVANQSYTSGFGARFTAISEKFKTSQKFKEGTFVLLEDNGSWNSDVFSSVSFFFREDVEELTDIERTRENHNSGRKFIIGKRLEDESIIEIVEKVGNRIQKVTTVPPVLYVVSNPFQLRMQKTAVNVLINEPSVHHKALLQLMDYRFHWGDVDKSLCNIHKWYVLNDSSYDGVDKQRDMAKLALCTKDFAFLEGPPGSGKTTTILEIIAQMIMRGERVMLAASTNAAIDNILERLNKLPENVLDKVLAVRIGNDGSVCEKVEEYRADKLEDKNLKEVVFRYANLVCGTTFGILKHPEFNLNSKKKNEMIPPLFDCLIVDEASKTTFQDFLVPALYAKRWILSGDIKQLTPYIEKEDIASSIRYMGGFDEKCQEIQGIIQQITKDNKLGDLRFCIPIAQNYVGCVSRLMPQDQPFLLIADYKSESCISPAQILNGECDCAKMYGAKVIFIERTCLKAVEQYLPADFIMLLEKDSGLGHLRFENDYYFKNKKIRGVLIDRSDYFDINEIRKKLNTEIGRRDWAGEIAWRVARQQELFMLKDIAQDGKDKVGELETQIQDRVPEPYRNNINKFLSSIRELSLPSILQLLKQGISDSLANKKFKTTLNSGFESEDYSTRSILLEYQGRMHPEISEFSRKYLYNNEALRDSSKLNRVWDYREYADRAVWKDVCGKKNCERDNDEEVRVIVEEISKFIGYAAQNPKKQDAEDNGVWSIAVLTYYKRQEAKLKQAISSMVKNPNPNRSFYDVKDRNVQIMIYSVDKFQGKEADVVFLSMVKSGGVGLGFMDSPNRLNVALTRAKFQRVIVGDRDYFLRSKNYLFEKLAGEEK